MDSTLTIHYEDIHDHFDETLNKLSQFLGLEPPDETKLLALREKTGLEHMKARYEARTDKLGLVRKGRMRDWQKIMSKEMVERFDAMTRKVFADAPIVNKFL